ncbi:MAG: restriction endonuclease subunit S [Gallionella sp.]|nr:restriction endonuclease subunit S [Gallionella sp.]
MSTYPKYPEYKDSGIDWLRHVPVGWTIDRAKWSVISCQNGIWGNDPDGEDDLVCIRVADFDRQAFKVATNKLTLRQIPNKDRHGRLLLNGDLLIEKSGGGDQQLVGAVVEFNQLFPAVTSNFVARMAVTKEMSGRFLTYMHAHLYMGRVNYRSIKQTTGIQNLDSQSYLDERIAYPSLLEQEKIARFLDYKTVQIDALIAKKEMLLARLAEKRTALISHAVTKGLDPTVPMKDSGVAWLGDIPAHWDAKRLKFIVSILGGGTPNTGKPQYWDGEIPWVSPKDMKSDLIESTEDYLSELGVKESATKIIPKDAVLVVVRSGILRHTIPVARNTVEVTLNQDMKALIPNERLCPEFLHYFISGLQDGLLPLWSKQGCTVESIEMGYMVNSLIPLPPPDEQKAIVRYASQVVEKLDLQFSKVKKVVASLQEYRAALITNAVTGKIDVRNVSIPASVDVEAS